MPNLVDRPTAELARSGVSAALAVDVRVVDSDRPRDTIVGQQPAPGTEVARGTVLRVSVSAGPPPRCAASDRRKRDGRHRSSTAHASAVQGGVRGA